MNEVPLSPEEIIHLDGGGSIPSGVTKPVHEVVAGLDSMQDFTSVVAELAGSPDKIWQSADPTKFQRNGKINFLHLDANGVFTLTVIKPGNMKSFQATITRKGVVDWVKQGLYNMTDWGKAQSPEKWKTPSGEWIDGAEGDQPGNTFTGYRTLLLNNGQVLAWDVFHENKDPTVVIRDRLYFAEKN